MGKAVNTVFLLGRLTSDIEMKQTPQGKQVGTFSLAVSKQTGEGADFFRCVAWEKTAEIMSQYLSRGSRVHVQGRLQQRTWEKDGQKREAVEVVVNDFTFVDTKADQQSSSGQTKRDTVSQDVGNEPINLDDIPF